MDSLAGAFTNVLALLRDHIATSAVTPTTLATSSITIRKKWNKKPRRPCFEIPAEMQVCFTAVVVSIHVTLLSTKERCVKTLKTAVKQTTEMLEELKTLRFSWKKIAELLDVWRWTVARRVE